MKLRNKKTGKIYDFKITPDYDDVMSGWKIENKDFGVRYYEHLAELNEEWEDYEEPKEDYIRVIESFIHYAEEADDSFYCDESVKKFIEKLKAWKRLKDFCNFSFNGIVTNRKGKVVGVKVKFNDRQCTINEEKQAFTDLALLFGGKE